VVDRRLETGKLPRDLLAELLAQTTSSPEVRLGPAVGEDAGVIDIPGGALVVATDPITLTGSQLGHYAVVVNANDVAVMGVRPRWFLAVLLLPVGTTVDDARVLFAGLSAALDEVGAILVGGHSEVTAAVNQPVVVGQMLGLAEDGHVVTTGGARSGDVVVQIGAVPIEGAAVLAAESPAALAALDPTLQEAARNAAIDPGISVVDAALAAAALGATSMHDPTEGGLASGLHELAAAAAVGIRVEPDAVHWFAPGVALCRELGGDPWATLASGALLATFPPAGAGDAIAELSASRVDVAAIGTVVEGSGVHDAAGVEVPWPERDEVARLLGG